MDRSECFLTFLFRFFRIERNSVVVVVVVPVAYSSEYYLESIETCPTVDSTLNKGNRLIRMHFDVGLPNSLLDGIIFVD